jgi:hypothetical protein
MERPLMDIIGPVIVMIAIVIMATILILNFKNKNLNIFVIERIKIGVEDWFKLVEWVFFLVAFVYVVKDSEFNSNKYIAASILITISALLILIYFLIYFLEIGNKLAIKFNKYEIHIKIICSVTSVVLIYLLAIILDYLLPLLTISSQK